MVKSFILMIQFLTRLPIKKQIEMERDTLAKGTLFFPLVGIIIGSIAGIVYYLLNFINSDLASFGAVFAIVFTTGGLHVDGLSDTADGFFSGRSREKVLEIMKDSRVGSFGVIAIVFILLLKYILIRSLPYSFVLKTLILSCGISRLGASFLFSFGKSAKPGGLGNMFTGKDSIKYLIISFIIFTSIGFLIEKAIFAISLITVFTFDLFLMKYSYRMIGGFTGDVYGAAIELGEVVSIFTFLVVRLWI
ncbi:adenosylcobinamide-GDP ribazoletransferase [Caloramator sp. E03]|uniref:adenosylcobinamide-GDP ribazoletransferase n=1 Tax=Caloramator sp. E03 TaxID=2576307 RepID=UPI0011104669|nr:adenosylcobinamide-GDP ribazoletransferase [Caloramator sp. E03]QCX32651.1 adenosylcobinamide-GDP ribazoletransferase [Caloramator sp. E03]